MSRRAAIHNEPSLPPGAVQPPLAGEAGRWTDVGVCAAILIAAGIWTFLLLLQGGRTCTSDCVVEMLPRMTVVARAFQGGTVPIWDPGSFAGAKPLWETYGGLYYPVLIPLYFLADTTDPRQATIYLQLIPYVLHITWTLLGGYLFGRRAMRINPAGALALGAVYAFAPLMLDIALVNPVQGYSYLPWIQLAVATVIRTGSRRAWAGGALAIGALGYATNPDTMNRVLFLVGLQTVIYWTATRRATSWSWREVGKVPALTLMPALGVGVFGFGAAGLYQGVTVMMSALSLSCDRVATFEPYSSATPGSLLGMLFPALFWTTESLGNVGGVCLLTASTYALLSLPRLSRRDREWVATAGLLTLFCVLTTLGKYTPVFGWLCTGLPTFFGFPHPARYTIGVAWGLALLGGFGISALTSRASSRGVLAVSGWPVAAAIVAAQVRPQIPFLDWNSASALQYAVAAGGLWLTALALPATARGWVVALGVALELLTAPASVILRLPADSDLEAMEQPHWTLDKSPFDDLNEVFRGLAAKDDFRLVGTRAYIDSQAWGAGARVLFGMMSRPLAPRFDRAIRTFALNSPQVLWLYRLPRFLQNMNVGYIVADRDPTFYSLLARVDADGIQREIESFPLVARRQWFDVRSLPEPMPYVYTQDRIEVADDEEQFRRLLDGDLREATVVSPDFRRDPARTTPEELAAPDVAARFAQLQVANRIRGVRRPDVNRKAIDVEMTRPALLVIAEQWHPSWRARIDGNDAKLWQVNYLQQGLWLEAGHHTVELEFRSEAARLGLVATIASLIVVLAVGFGGHWRR